MKRSRRLRRLAPDEALLRRRAGGETVRQLAPDYAVAHTTLSRYFARPDVIEQLEHARRLLRAEELASQQTQLKAARTPQPPPRRRASKQPAAARVPAPQASNDRGKRVRAPDAAHELAGAPRSGARAATLLRRRAGAPSIDRLDRLDRLDRERVDPSFEMRLRNAGGIEIGHKIVGRTEALALQAQGWEHIPH